MELAHSKRDRGIGLNRPVRSRTQGGVRGQLITSLLDYPMEAKISLVKSNICFFEPFTKQASRSGLVDDESGPLKTV